MCFRYKIWNESAPVWYSEYVHSPEEDDKALDLVNAELRKLGVSVSERADVRFLLSFGIRFVPCFNDSLAVQKVVEW